MVIQNSTFLNYIIINSLNLVINYFNLQVKIGAKVATINEENNKDLETNSGKKSFGKIIPTNNDFEKSGLGNNNKPAIKPIIIEKYIFFSLNDFE